MKLLVILLGTLLLSGCSHQIESPEEKGRFTVQRIWFQGDNIKIWHDNSNDCDYITYNGGGIVKAK